MASQEEWCPRREAKELNDACEARAKQYLDGSMLPARNCTDDAHALIPVAVDRCARMARVKAMSGGRRHCRPTGCSLLNGLTRRVRRRRPMVPRGVRGRASRGHGKMTREPLLECRTTTVKGVVDARLLESRLPPICLAAKISASRGQSARQPFHCV